MSKIGRRPMDISGVQVEIKGQEVHYKGPKDSGIHALPVDLSVEVEDKLLKLVPSQDASKELNRVWGLHRALLFNKLKGAVAEFEKEVHIIGLGYKAQQQSGKLVFSLGYSHKIDFEMPKEVSVTIDKSGQKLLFKSSSKELLGHVCSKVCALRLPEPYKGTGIIVKGQKVRRKAGKAKSAA